MMELAAFDKCTGCEACVQICPKSAISLALKKTGLHFLLVYAAKTLDEDIRKRIGKEVFKI